MWTISNWLGKKQNINPTVDLGEPTSFLDQVYLGCTQRECQISKGIVDDNYSSMFESRISAWATEKLQETKATVKLDAETISSWSHDMEGHAQRSTWKDIANLSEQLYKVATPCLDDQQFREEEENGICMRIHQKYAHKLFWNACIWLVWVNLTSHVPWTSLLALSQNWPELVTNGWIVWSLTCITHVTPNNVVMWDKQHNKAD